METVDGDDLPHDVQVHLACDLGVDAQGSESSVKVSVFFVRDLWGTHTYMTSAQKRKGGCPKFADKYYTDIVDPEHESSIFRSFILPCMWFSMMEQVRLCAVWPTENWLGTSKATYRDG